MKNSTTTQALVIPYTTTHRIKSEINNVEYELFVAVPPGYHDSQNSYSTIFTTDPNFIFSILLGATKSLEGLIPNAIVVGIGHADLDFQALDKATHTKRHDVYRARDFLPWQLGDWGLEDFSKYFPQITSELEYEMINSSGRAEDFVKFIESTVVPFIDKTYRTKPEHTLIGHSFGGVFASWILLNHPNIFQNYVIISPILDLKKGAMFDEISHLDKSLPTKIYLCAGACEALHSTNKNFLADLRKFHDQLISSPNVTAKLEIFEDEYHASVVPFGILKGLRFIYR